MKNEIMLTILDSFTMLTLNNPNGSSTQITLTPEQMDYIEKTIKLNKEINQLAKLFKQQDSPPPANDGDGSRPTGGTQLLRREILAQDLQEWTGE